MKFVNKIICLALASFLVSCAPTLREYYQPKYKFGELTSTGCSGSGPADLLKVPLAHNVTMKIRASISNSEESNRLNLNLKYEVPSDVSIEFIEQTIKVYAENLEVAELEISKFSTPTWDKTYSSYFVDAGTKLLGETIYRKTLFGEFPIHRPFSLSYSQTLPAHYSSFEVLLPSVIINGDLVEFSMIHFENIKKMGIDPLNC